jgi:hypothetical protein
VSCKQTTNRKKYLQLVCPKYFYAVFIKGLCLGLCSDLLSSNLNVIIIEYFQFVGDIVGLVAQQLDLFLVRLQHGQRLFNLFQLLVHVGGGGVDHTTQTGKGAGQFSVSKGSLGHLHPTFSVSVLTVGLGGYNWPTLDRQ